MTRAREAAVRVGALVVVATIVLASCALPHDNAPRVLSKEAVPYSLLSSSTTTLAPPPVGAFPVSLFFIQGDRLVKVTEDLTRVTANEVLQALLAGPSADPVSEVTTAIPRETQLRNTVETPDDTLIIDLSSDILSVEGPEQHKAFAQLVYTAYAIREIRGVRFRIEGEDQPIPTDNGEKRGPLTSGDFESLRPPT
jgi:hypothetical protein